jgi:hypothetical protein
MVSKSHVEYEPSPPQTVDEPMQIANRHQWALQIRNGKLFRHCRDSMIFKRKWSEYESSKSILRVYLNVLVCPRRKKRWLGQTLRKHFWKPTWGCKMAESRGKRCQWNLKRKISNFHSWLVLLWHHRDFANCRRRCLLSECSGYESVLLLQVKKPKPTIRLNWRSFAHAYSIWIWRRTPLRERSKREKLNSSTGAHR